MFRQCFLDFIFSSISMSIEKENLLGGLGITQWHCSAMQKHSESSTRPWTQKCMPRCKPKDAHQLQDREILEQSASQDCSGVESSLAQGHILLETTLNQWLNEAGIQKAWPFWLCVGHSAGQHSPQGAPLGLPGFCWVDTMVWLVPSPNPAFLPFLL